MDLSQKQRKFRIGLVSAIALSLLVHFFIATGLFIYQPPAPSSGPIEVQLVEKQAPTNPELKKDMPRQIVDQDEKAVNDEIDDKAKYLSAHNQKIQKQTVATHHGDFQNQASKSNIAGNGGRPTKLDVKDFTPKFDVAKSVHDHEQREQEFEKDPNAVKLADEKPQSKPATSATPTPNGDSGEKVSQTIDYLKSIDAGLETMLSTREFVYYTYYARIRRQLNQYWSSKVKDKLIAMYKQGRQIASSDDKITRCLVTLDKKGDLVRVQIIGISGVHELDEAAVDSFKAAAPFPNPPTGIVDEDGTIKIRWDFILEV